MRIRWVKAVAFGGLVDQTLSLRDGLNVVVGPNESGKSTWHAALFAGLCGRSEELEASESSEFDRRPWHASGWAVETMLERDNDDPVLVYQDLLNPASSTATELSGPQDGGRHDISSSVRYHGGLDTAEWVGLDRHSYAATAWVQQGSGRNQLSDAVGLCIREEDAVRACDRIDRLRQRHIGEENDPQSPLGRAEAELVDRRAELIELRDLHEQHSRAQAEYGQWTAFTYAKEQDLVAAELSAAQHRVVELQTEIRQSGDDPFAKPYAVPGAPDVVNDQAYEAIVSAEREVRAAEQALVVAATTRPATLNRPSRTSAWAVREPEPSTVAVAHAQHGPTLLEPNAPGEGMLGQISSIEYEPGTYGTQRRSRWRALRQPEGRALVVGILAVLVVAAGVGLAVLLNSIAVGAILVAIGVGLAVIAVVIGLRNPVRDLEVPAVALDIAAPAVESFDRHERPEQYEQVASELSTVELDDSRVRDARRQLVWALKAAGYATDMETVESVAAQYHRDRSQHQRDELERKARDEANRGNLETQLRQAQADVARLAQRVDGNTPLRVGVIDPAQARTAYEHAVRELNRTEHARDATTSALANRISVTAAEDSLDQARRKLTSMRRLKELLDEAYGYLSRSRVGARREIASALETSVGRSLPHITDGHYPHVKIAASDFRITISDPAVASLDPMRGARSTREQTYLSARVALGDQLSRRRLYGPLLLDDVTSSADGPRVNGLLDLLYRFAQVRQVVVFAHEETVAVWAERKMDSHPNVHLIRLTTPDHAPHEVILAED